jgi:hypothetical protein
MKMTEAGARDLGEFRGILADMACAKNQKVTITPTLQCNTNESAITDARQRSGLTRVLQYQIGPAMVAGERHSCSATMRRRRSPSTSSTMKAEAHRPRLVP